jgi:hypothetical protein
MYTVVKTLEIKRVRKNYMAIRLVKRSSEELSKPEEKKAVSDAEVRATAQGWVEEFKEQKAKRLQLNWKEHQENSGQEGTHERRAS